MLSDMQVFNQYYMGPTIETLAQRIEAFNAASNGAIVLTAEGFDGDFLQGAFFAALHSAQRRVDMYGANSAVSPVSLSQVKESAVKVAGGFDPILFEPAQMNWIRQASGEAVEAISRNFAEAMLADQINTAILALVAAIGNQADLVNDVSAGTGGAGALSYQALNMAHAKFGDMSGMISATVMNGTAAHNLVGQNINNANRLFQAQGVLVIDILGRPVVVIDAPALYESGTPNKVKALSLVEGAATVFDGSNVITNLETSNGKERIETTFQANYDFGLGLKGYAWDETNGGKSPTDAEIGTGSNWDVNVTSLKHTAGVMAIGDAAQVAGNA